MRQLTNSVFCTLHSHGFRYRVCVAKLPGKPDLWLAKLWL
ncbi:very short patch repair endonuclease [Vibrio alginolyticus]|nr:very short patch repair endonuclease [Vibrio alginolyticus]